MRNLKKLTAKHVGRRREGLRFARLLMVLSSFFPLFVLWALRGSNVIPKPWFTVSCLLLAVLPTAALYYREYKARKNHDKRELVAGTSDDHRSHVLVYLFTILLPFYHQDLATLCDMLSMILALAFIVFLFYRLNLHYMNFLFALRHYQVFTVTPPDDGNPHSGKEKFVLITKRQRLSPGERFHAYRLSDAVYIEG